MMNNDPNQYNQNNESFAAPEKKEEPAAKKPNVVIANIQLLIVLLFIIGGIFLSTKLHVKEERPRENAPTKPLLVSTSKVTPQTQEVTFNRTGTVEVNGQINIVPQVSGRIVYVNPVFNDGGVFKKGDVLFKIEQADFVNQVNVARAQVEHARTNLSLQEADSNAAIEEWKSLNPNRPAPDLVAREPQLEQARASLTSAKAQLGNAQLDLKRTKVSYEFGGRVISTSIELGQFVQAGQSYGMAYPENALEVSVPVEDRLLKYIDTDKGDEQGNKVSIHADYRGEKIQLEGVIDRIGSTLDTTTRFVDVIIQPNDDQWNILVPGVFVDVELKANAIENVWAMPNGALQGQDQIWIVKGDNTLQSYRPTIITKNDTKTFAIGNGQEARVVLGLLKGASDGMSVNVTETPTKNAEEVMGTAPPESNEGL